MHSAAMSPKDLIGLLMRAEGKNPNSLAAAMGMPQMQGQIHRFLAGEVKSPRRETAERFARYFDIPVDAVYDAGTALLVAQQRGLADGVLMAASGSSAYAATPDERVVVDVPASPLGTSMPLEDAVRVLAAALSEADPVTRQAAGVYLSSLAADPDRADWVASRIRATLDQSKPAAA